MSRESEISKYLQVIAHNVLMAVKSYEARRAIDAFILAKNYRPNPNSEFLLINTIAQALEEATVLGLSRALDSSGNKTRSKPKSIWALKELAESESNLAEEFQWPQEATDIYPYPSKIR